MFTHFTDINTIFGYCHVSVLLFSVKVSYLENASVYLPVLNSKIAIMFFLLMFNNTFSDDNILPGSTLVRKTHIS